LDSTSSQKPLAGHGNDRDSANPEWDSESALNELTYEEMILRGQRYLCQIPKVDGQSDGNATAKADTHADGNKTGEEKELARATDRGLELLQEMEGTCLFYVSGWWSYSFCYKSQVRQFHALPTGPGVPNYPPMEDPSTHSFVLGKFQQDDDEDGGEGDRARRRTDVAELQTKGESRYLVQRLGGGTTCDLTGKERRIEVQFHCHPQSSDRIGWIKELTTCSYLMVIYTPRLCHDVAFQLPQPEDVHLIECREIIAPKDVAEWEALKAHRATQRLVNSGAQEFPIVGGIEVGAMKLVGTEGRQIEKGRVASAGQEIVEVVAKKENGEVTRLSREDLQRFDLDPEKIESLRKQLEDLANGKDWKLEVIEANGERGLRGTVAADDDDDEDEGEEGSRTQQPEQRGKKAQKNNRRPSQDDQQVPEDGSDEGSEEIFKEEL
jgi:hypothetical protein